MSIKNYVIITFILFSLNQGCATYSAAGSNVHDMIYLRTEFTHRLSVYFYKSNFV